MLKRPENLKIGEEMIVKDIEKSGEFGELGRHGCKRY